MPSVPHMCAEQRHRGRGEGMGGPGTGVGGDRAHETRRGDWPWQGEEVLEEAGRGL